MNLEVIDPLTIAIETGSASVWDPALYHLIDDPPTNHFGSHYTQSFRASCFRPDLFLYRVRHPDDLLPPAEQPTRHHYVLALWIMRPPDAGSLGLFSVLESLDGHPDWFPESGGATAKPSPTFLTTRLRVHPTDQLARLIAKLDRDASNQKATRIALNEKRRDLAAHFRSHTHPHDQTARMVETGAIPVSLGASDRIKTALADAAIRSQVANPGVPTPPPLD